jgi:hypothetical protein
MEQTKSQFINSLGFEGFKNFGLTLIKEINNTANIKITLVTNGRAGHYEGLTLEIVKKDEGVIDEVLVLFDDVLEIKSYNEGFEGLEVIESCGWEWYVNKPTSKSLGQLRNTVEEFISLYR